MSDVKLEINGHTITFEIPDFGRFKFYETIFIKTVSVILEKISKNKKFFSEKVINDIGKMLAIELDSIVVKFEKHKNNTEDCILELENIMAEKYVENIQKRLEKLKLERANTEKLEYLIEDRAEIILQATLIAIERFSLDQEAMCRIALKSFNIDINECQIRHFIYTNSDPHHGGQTVIILEIAYQQQTGSIVYKPSTILIDLLLVGNIRALEDYHLLELITKDYGINDKPISLFGFLNLLLNKDNNLPTYSVYPRKREDDDKEYGYIEYIKKESKGTTFQHWKVAGMIAIIALLFGMTDIHKDNLLKLAFHLILIDLENSFNPEYPSATKSFLFQPETGGFSHLDIHLHNTSETLKFFLNGISTILNLISKEPLENWLEQQLLHKVHVRVLPFSTQEFTKKRNQIILSLLKGNDIQSIINSFDIALLNDRLELRNLLKSASHRASLVICLAQADIPIYQAHIHATSLIDSFFQIIRTNEENILNYFLQTPFQGLVSKLKLCSNLAYQDFLERYLTFNFLYYLSNSNESTANHLDGVRNLFEYFSKTTYELFNLLRLLQGNLLHQQLFKKIGNIINKMFSYTDSILKYIFIYLKTPNERSAKKLSNHAKKENIIKMKLERIHIKNPGLKRSKKSLSIEQLYAELIQTERGSTAKLYTEKNNSTFSEGQTTILKLLGASTLQQTKKNLSASAQFPQAASIDSNRNENDKTQNLVEAFINTWSKNISSKDKELIKALKESRAEFLANNKIAISLNNHAKNFGFTPHGVPADGNCFFHAIADQLHSRLNITADADILRASAISHIINNYNEFRPFLSGLSNYGAEGYISHMAENQTWADEPVIQALASELHINIVIIRSDRATPNIINGSEEAERTLYLGYYVDLHYISLHGQPNQALLHLLPSDSSQNNLSLRRQ